MSLSQGERKRRREADFFNLARSSFPDVPCGDFEQPAPPTPDILVRTEGYVLGVEVTQLFQPGGGDIEGLQRRILRAAEVQWRHELGEAVFVNATFAQGCPPKLLVAVEQLLGLIRRHLPAPESWRELRAGSVEALDLPSWMQALAIFRTGLDLDRPWVGGSVWSTETVTREQLESVIRRKEQNIEDYRSCCDRVWLLVICDLWPMAASFSVPAEASTWTFEHAFDRVLLVSRENGHASY